MKKLLIFLAMATALNAGIEQDKYEHIFAGAIIYGGCIVISNIIYEDPNAELCLIAPLAAGIGKEVWDSQHDNHVAEWQDVAATMAIPTASIVIYKW